MTSLGFKARVGSALFVLGGGVCVTRSLIFISGVTPADLLVTSIIAEPSLPHNCEQALVVLKTGSYHTAAQSVYIASLCQFTNYIVDPEQKR